jgi:hypothetical protein
MVHLLNTISKRIIVICIKMKFVSNFIMLCIYNVSKYVTWSSYTQVVIDGSECGLFYRKSKPGQSTSTKTCCLVRLYHDFRPPSLTESPRSKVTNKTEPSTSALSLLWPEPQSGRNVGKWNKRRPHVFVKKGKRETVMNRVCASHLDIYFHVALELFPTDIKSPSQRPRGLRQ